MKNMKGLFVLIDFTKAFDSVSWSFIYNALEYFRFENNIINWIKILNKDFKAAVFCQNSLKSKEGVDKGNPDGGSNGPIFIYTRAFLTHYESDQVRKIVNYLKKDNYYSYIYR